MRVRSPPRRRLGRSRVLFFFSGVLLCVVYALSLRARLSEPRADGAAGGAGEDVVEVSVREVTASNVTEEEEERGDVVPPDSSKPLVIVVNRTDIEQCIYVDPQPPKPPPTPPPPTTTSTRPPPPLQSPLADGAP